MELRQLRHFVAVVDAGNLSVAAARANLSQPALSRSIKNLELTLGTRLLERRARGVVPTAAGRIFASEARFILNECQRTRDEIAAFAKGAEGRVALGVAPMFIASIAADALDAVHSVAPSLELMVVEGAYSEMVDQLAAGQLDVLLTQFPESALPRAAVAERLCMVTAIVAAGATNPISRKRKLTAADFVDAKWVTIGRGWDASVIDQYMMSNGLPPPARPLHTNSVVLTKTLIAEKGYVSMLPNHVLTREIERGEINALPMPTGGFRRAAGLMYRARDEQRPGVALVIENLRAACRQFSRRFGKTAA
jgi:DNA-binding transcriptional LysR family regulator